MTKNNTPDFNADRSGISWFGKAWTPRTDT
jgi:hypothetical protein